MTIEVNTNQKIVDFEDIEIGDAFRYNGFLWLKIDDNSAFKFYNLTAKCAGYDTDDFYNDTEVTPVNAELKVEM